MSTLIRGNEQRKRLIQSIVETQRIIDRLCRGQEKFRDQELVNTYVVHRDKLLDELVAYDKENGLDKVG